MPILFFDDDTLLCPHCGSLYLHHDRVEVFERREDQEQGTHVTVHSADTLTDKRSVSVKIDNDLAGNPSGRRHGLSVGFWCEECHGRSVLTIAQHKGATLVDLEKAGQ